MVPRITGVVFLAVLSAAAFAQEGKTVTIAFSSEGQREVWIQKGPRATDSTGSQSLAGKSVLFPVPDETEGMILCVHDVATGTVGTTPLESVIKAGTWTFDPTAAKTAFSARFQLSHNNEPVSSAVVKMKDANGERDVLVTPSDKGIASFSFVPFGDVTVGVDYKTEGKSASLPMQTFTITGKSSITPVAITIQDPVETIRPETAVVKDVPAANDTGAEATPPPKSPANPAATALNMILGAAVVGGIGYAIYRYATQNQSKVDAAFGKIGLPTDAGAPPKPSGPPKQIILNDSSPTTSSEPTVLAGAGLSGSVAKNPRFVKSDGSVLLLQDGTQTVGRDAGTDHPHTGESSMSRTHALIEKVGDGVTVSDAGSTNGTFVNGRKISAPTTISPGDTVQFGAIQYRYEE